MLIDTQKVSPWYVFHRGFRLTKYCRNCGSENSHYKAAEKDYSGFLSKCESCGKEIVKLKSTINYKAPFNSNSPINHEIFRRVREGAGIVEGFNRSVVEFLHS